MLVITTVVANSPTAARKDAPGGCLNNDCWVLSPENINKLPEPIRSYIHDLETFVDPAGIIQENAILKDQNKQLIEVIMEKIDINIIIDIDCYGCGENLSIPFRLGVQQAEYCYCLECQEGVEILNVTGTLSISRLEQE